MIGLALLKSGIQYAAGGVPLIGKPDVNREWKQVVRSRTGQVSPECALRPGLQTAMI